MREFYFRIGKGTKTSGRHIAGLPLVDKPIKYFTAFFLLPELVSISRDAYAAMVKDNLYAESKELLIIPDAVHTVGQES